ncbi:MAG: sensor histidine kinase [Armatimonadota bacterium]
MDYRGWRTGEAEGPARPLRWPERLQVRLEQAQAGERRAQALLESVASLMGGVDIDDALRGIAENAVRHIGFARVLIYRADQDAGALIPVARAEPDRADDHLPPAGLSNVRVEALAEEPVPLLPGHWLADFALDDELYRILDRAEVPAGSRSGVLAQMRCGRRTPASPHGILAGVLAAYCDEQVTPRQVDLLSALASLGAAAADAARIEQFRTQLISAVSHELRTPLAAIRAYNELLLDGDAGEINDEQRLFLERIEATCLHLDRLVEDLLDLSRLRAGELVIHKEPVDVAAVIEHIVDTLSSEARRQEVELRSQVQPGLPLLMLDADRLAQVLFNLVGNGVKYTGRGGTVVVRAGVKPCAEYPQLRARDDARQPQSSCAETCLAIEVADDGPGIAPEDINRIFDEFFRGRLTEGSAKGSGLGLAIAARLTRLLGGIITVHSTPGEGSTFALVFPLESDKPSD